VLGFDDLPSHWQRSYLANDKAIKRLDDFIKLRGEIAHRGKAADTVKKVTVLDAFGHVKELVDLTNGATFAYLFKVTGKNPY
jgi:hypothetical protein